MTASDPNGRTLLGFGALACVACCAGPLLAFLGGLSIASFAGTTVVGGLGLIVGFGAAAAYLVVRQRRSRVCAARHDEPVAVAGPTRKDTAQ